MKAWSPRTFVWKLWLSPLVLKDTMRGSEYFRVEPGWDLVSDPSHTLGLCGPGSSPNPNFIICTSSILKLLLRFPTVLLLIPTRVPWKDSSIYCLLYPAPAETGSIPGGIPDTGFLGEPGSGPRHCRQGISFSLLTRTATLGGGLGAGTHTLLGGGGVSHTLGCTSFCSCLPRASTCWGTEVSETLVE